MKAKRRRSHHLAAIGLRAKIRQSATGDHGRRHLSLAPQTPDGVFGTHPGQTINVNGGWYMS